MSRYQMQTDLTCVLCNNSDESHCHLFGFCPYTVTLMKTLNFDFSGSWASYVNGQFFSGRMVGIRKLIGYLALAVSFYMIWQVRNTRIHDTSHSNPAIVTSRIIKRMVREKLHSSKQFKQAATTNPNLVLDIF